MRFRILHLLVVFAIVAIGLFWIDQYACDTAIVEFPSAFAMDQEVKTLLPIDKEADYQLNFTVRNAPNSISGGVFGKYGPNRLLATQFSESNVSQFVGRTAKIKFRRRALPWRPATQVVDELGKHFLSVMELKEADHIEDRL